MKLFLISLTFAFFAVGGAEGSPADHIDELILQHLKEQNIKPNAPIDDDTFLRRNGMFDTGRPNEMQMKV